MLWKLEVDYEAPEHLATRSERIYYNCARAKSLRRQEDENVRVGSGGVHYQLHIAPCL